MAGRAPKTTLTDLAAAIPDEAAAYEYLERLRWPSGVPTCPHCGHHGANFIKPRNGATRTTRTGAQTARRLWQCKKCRKQFSAMTGTIFHGSKIALRIWLFVLFEMCANKNGMAAREIERKYGLSPKSSWFMAHRIREAMKAKAPGSMVGIIVVDETYIGGDPGLMNKKARAKWEAKRMTPHSGFRGNSSDKAPVLSLINANTGEVRSAVVPKVDGTNLRKVIAAQVNMAGSTLWTDEGSWYGQIGEEFLAHETVNHSDEEYVGRHGQSTNKLESYFSQLKRSLDGTHHRVSEEHLPRYLTHFDFLYTTRDLPESLRMAQLVDQAEGRRLSYKRVKG